MGMEVCTGYSRRISELTTSPRSTRGVSIHVAQINVTDPFFVLTVPKHSITIIELESAERVSIRGIKGDYLAPLAPYTLPGSNLKLGGSTRRASIQPPSG